MSNQSNSGSGLGLGTTLTIIFVILKLTEVIDWSWWLVFAPMWIPVVLLLALIIFAVIKGN